MKLVIDLLTNTIAGSTNDPAFNPSSTQVLIDTPEDFDSATSAEWAYDGMTVSHDPMAAMERAKTARKSRIKAEAGQLIAASDWKLNRAKEQEQAGWSDLAAVDAILVQRETIRQSSNAAELAVDALTDVVSVIGFTWVVDVVVIAPRRLTSYALLSRFTSAEIEAVLAAAETNAALRVWWEKFKLAASIDLNNADTIAGINAFETAGLLTAGRAAEILL